MLRLSQEQGFKPMTNDLNLQLHKIPLKDSSSPCCKGLQVNPSQSPETKMSSKLRDTSIECKTPSKFHQEIEPFTTIKPSLEKKSVFERSSVGLLYENKEDLGQSTVEKREETSEKESPILRQKVKINSIEVTLSTAPSSTECKKTPRFLGSNENSRKDPSTQAKNPLKRKFLLIGSPPLYTPNKKMKMNKQYYSGSVKLLDKQKESTLEFRVFRDSELGNSSVIQNTVRVSRLDEDCQTDSEQLLTATERVQQQLKEAVEKQYKESKSKDKQMPETLNLLSSQSPSGKNTSGAVSVDLDKIEAGPEDLVPEHSERVTPLIVKKLSFSEAE